MTDIEDLRRDLQAARADLLASLAGVTPEECHRTPPGEVTDEEQRWPIVQVLWHVGQVEDRFRRQIEQRLGGRPILAEPFHPRPAYLTEPAQLLAWLDQSRRPTETLLRRLTDADLDLAIERPDGRVTSPRRCAAGRSR